MREVYANSLFQHTASASGSKLLISLLLSVSFALGAYGQRGSVADVCRETKTVLAQYHREQAELTRTIAIKKEEDGFRRLLSELRRAIANGYVYNGLNMLNLFLGFDVPPDSSIERREYQKTVRTALERELQKALNADMDELSLQLDRVTSQVKLRERRMGDLKCYEVLDRERAGTTDPAILASLQRFSGTWYAGGLGGCWQTTVTVSGDKMTAKGTFTGPFTDNTEYEGKWNGSAFVGTYTGDYNNPGCVSCKVTQGKRAGTFSVTYNESANALDWTSNESEKSEVFRPRSFSGKNVKTACK